MRDEYLVTEGVHSTVWTRTDGRLNGLGHVALFDWDDHVTEDDVLAFDGLDGPTFIWESSQGKLHGWNVVVRRFPAAAQMLERYDDDTNHNRVGKDRGWWRLRVGEKRPVEDDVYKSSPEYLGLHDTHVGGVVSDPHLELARVCGVPETAVESVRERYEPIGDGTKVVAYATMTDIEKKVRGRIV